MLRAVRPGGPDGAVPCPDRQECYAQLLAEGFLSARGGSGTRVAASAALPPAATDRSAARRPGLAIDFRPGWPDVSRFPRQDWMWAMREAAHGAPDDAFGYGDPRGAAELRAVLASYLHRVRGAVADPERIVICAGTEEQAVVAAAAERSIGLHPMSRYRSRHTTQPPQLVIGFGNLTEPTIARGIATIADLLA